MPEIRRKSIESVTNTGQEVNRVTNDSLGDYIDIDNLQPAFLH